MFSRTHTIYLRWDRFARRLRRKFVHFLAPVKQGQTEKVKMPRQPRVRTQTQAHTETQQAHAEQTQQHAHRHPILRLVRASHRFCAPFVFAVAFPTSFPLERVCSCSRCSISISIPALAKLPLCCPLFAIVVVPSETAPQQHEAGQRQQTESQSRPRTLLTSQTCSMQATPARQPVPRAADAGPAAHGNSEETTEKSEIAVPWAI